MLLYLIADKRGEGMQRREWRSERTTSQIRSTQECSVDIDGPKQRAEWRDRHLSREKTDRRTAEARDTHTEPPKNLAEYIKGVARSRFLTHFRFSHELNIAPWGFVNSRPVCIFREAVIAVSVRSSRLNKPKWEVFEHGYQLGCFILAL